MIVSPKHNVACTLGQDGVLKLWDIINSKEIYSSYFVGKGTCLDWLPDSPANHGRVIVAGFDNGIVRVIQLNRTEFQILNTFKAHDGPVYKVKFSNDSMMLVSAGADGMFFFELEPDNMQTYEPLCMIQLEAKITDMGWDNLAKKVIVGLESGKVFIIDRPKKSQINNTESYLVTLPMKQWQIKMMEFQMKKNQKKDEAELE